jgi:hypothetical protein
MYGVVGRIAFLACLMVFVQFGVYILQKVIQIEKINYFLEQISKFFKYSAYLKAFEIMYINLATSVAI